MLVKIFLSFSTSRGTAIHSTPYLCNDSVSRRRRARRQQRPARTRDVSLPTRMILYTALPELLIRSHNTLPTCFHTTQLLPTTGTTGTPPLPHPPRPPPFAQSPVKSPLELPPRMGFSELAALLAGPCTSSAALLDSERSYNGEALSLSARAEEAVDGPPTRPPRAARRRRHRRVAELSRAAADTVLVARLRTGLIAGLRPAGGFRALAKRAMLAEARAFERWGETRGRPKPRRRVRARRRRRGGGHGTDGELEEGWAGDDELVRDGAAVALLLGTRA